MKKLLLLFMLPLYLTAQVSDERKLEFNSVSLFGGSGSMGGTATSISDFEKLSSNSTFIKNDFTGFDTYNYFDNYLDYTGVYFNFDIQSSENSIFKNKSLRLGVSFAENSALSLGYFKDDYFRIDTLTSSQTGKETYVDSIRSQNYTFDYTQQQIFLNAAYLVGTNPESRFSFYSGLEISLGFSISNQTELSYSEYNSYDGFYGSNYKDLDKDRVSTTESYRNQSGFAFMASIPFGVDFRVGKNRPFWRKCHFILEYKPGLSIISIPEIGTFSNTSAIGSGGFRYEF